MKDKNNLLELVKSLKEVYNYADKKIELILNKLLIEKKNDSFYENIDISSILNKETPIIIMNYLKRHSLTEEEIKIIVLNHPYLLMYSNNLDNLFIVFKNNEYKAYVLLDGDTYRCYKSIGSIYNENNHSFEEEYNYLNNNKNIVFSDLYDNAYISPIISSVKRKDIKELLKIEEKDSIKEKFNKLSKEYSRKNIYFKKPKTK